MGPVQYANIQRQRSWGPPGKRPEITNELQLHLKRSGCQSCRTTRAWCCLRCCYPAPALLQTCNANHWIFWPVRLNASALTTGPFAFFTTTSDPTSQTSPSISCFSWTGKSLSTHFAAPTLEPCTIICSYPWTMPCNTRSSPPKMTWISSWGISLP